MLEKFGKYLDKNKFILAVVVLGVASFILINLAPPAINFNGGINIRLLKDNDDVGVYYERTRWVPEGGLPYRDVRQEYPQAAVLYLSLIRFFSDNFDNFALIFRVMSLFVFLGLILVTYKVIKQQGRSQAYLLLFCLPSFLYFTFNRFDILPALLVQLGILFFIKRKINISILLLVIAFFVKWYALFVLLAFFVYLYQRKDKYDFKKEVVLPLVVSIVFFVGIMVASFLLFGFYSIALTYDFHATRNLEVGGLLTVLSILTAVMLKNGELLRPIADIYSYLLKIVFCCHACLLFFYRRKVDNTKKLILALSSLVIIFIITLNFNSPQWIMWFLPLLILVIDQWWEIILLIIYDLLNFLFFPILFDIKFPNIMLDKWLFIVSMLKIIILIYFVVIITRKIFAGGQKFMQKDARGKLTCL